MAKSAKNKDDKPLCYGTYVGEGDILCSNCKNALKKECIKYTNNRDRAF
jgi:hypothetical protein